MALASRPDRWEWIFLPGLAVALIAYGARSVGQSPVAGDPWVTLRHAMVARQLQLRGISDERVLDAMRRVPRHRFVPPEVEQSAYEDRPLPIGLNQTISQPFIVGYMSEALQLAPPHRVLEVGTGSGYQAAILAELVSEVYSVELLPELAQRATRTLDSLGYRNVHIRVADGYLGWPEHAPFDRIIVTAAPEHVPQPLLDQLAVGGRLVAPIGGADQWIRILTKTPERIVDQTTIQVRFVPLVRPTGVE